MRSGSSIAALAPDYSGPLLMVEPMEKNLPHTFACLLLTDQEGRTMKRFEKLFYLIFAIFITSLYWPNIPALNNLLAWSMVVFSLTSERWKLKKQKLSGQPILLLTIAFFILHIVSAFRSQNTEQGFSLLLIRSPLLFLPLAVGTFSFSRSLRHRILFLFSILTTVTAVVCFIYAASLAITHSDSSMLYNDWLSKAIDMQSVYFALIVSLAIFAYTYLLRTEPFTMPLRFFIFAAIAFLLAIEFLLASRTQLLFFLFTALLFFIYHFGFQKKRILMATGLIVCLYLIALSLTALFPKTANRFNDLHYPNYSFEKQTILSHYNMKVTPEQWNGLNLRLAIWRCGMELFYEHPIAGIPLGDKKDALLKKYGEKDFKTALYYQFNYHNTYLDVLTTFGIFGLILFLTAFFILPFRRCWKARDYFGMLILGAFLFAMATEAYLDRRIGCILVGFFIPFAWNNSHNANDSSTVH